MNIITVKNYEEMSKMAAHILAAQVIAKPDSVLGLATGSTPIGIYDCLAEWCKNGEVDFSKAATVNLDEYRGLDHSNDQSYYYFMNKHLFSRINIDPSRTNVPDGTEPDPEKESKRYEALIQELGGIDIQLLGIGHDGHIGFNEPNSFFDKETHCVDLTEMTIEANKRFFESIDDVPRQAYTMGIEEDSDGSHRRGQGRHRGKGILRRGNTGGSGFHHSVPSECNRYLRRSSHVQGTEIKKKTQQNPCIWRGVPSSAPLVVLVRSL